MAGHSSVKPYAAYAIGAALIDTEIQVTDDELSSMGIEKGMMTLVDQARQADMLTQLSDHLIAANHQEFRRLLSLAHHDGNSCATRTRLEARVLFDKALQPAVQLLSEISHGFLIVSPPSVKRSSAEQSQAGCHMLTVYRP